MINFCKKSFYTLFNTTTGALGSKEDSSATHHRITPLAATDFGSGLNFLATCSEIPKTNNVIESSSLMNIPEKSDEIETGLEVLNIGDTDKLAWCTEGLGFESCNERSLNNIVFENSEKSGAYGKWRKLDKKNKEVKNKSFPPPLSSFNDKGKPTFFLRPVRNNGRLELTEVKINRPQSLRASRQDGRLRLHLVVSDHKKDDVITATDVVGEDCRWLHEQHNMHGWGQQCVSRVTDVIYSA